MATAQRNRTHCPQGHPYDEANTTRSSGRRICRACTNARWKRRHPVVERDRVGEIMAKFTQAEECWLWRGAMQNQGYGVFGRPPILAHRLVYELLVGPIPGGFTLDHTCHKADGSCCGGSDCLHRRCVNPAHLEPVPLATNVLRGMSPPARNARKTHCPKGHPYDSENTYVTPSTGWRQCRSCNRDRAPQRPQGG